MFTVSMIFNKYLISFYRAHNSGHVNLVTDGVIFRIDLFFFLSIINIGTRTHALQTPRGPLGQTAFSGVQ